MFVFTLAQLASYDYDRVASALVPSNRPLAPTDATAVITGIATALKQFHPDQTVSYLLHLGQYARSIVSRDPDAHAASRVRVVVAWTKTFARFADVSIHRLAAFFPPFVLEHAFD